MHEIGTGIFKTDITDNIFLIGDIHGDYQCLIHCLVDLCKVCNITNIFNDVEHNEPQREHLVWNNSNSIIIFCGDMIHRKRFNTVLDDECSDVFILKTLLRLKKEAITNGGNIILISGNHEIMNITTPNINTYISQKNININNKCFNNSDFVNNYIDNSYAWIKVNDILITHAGLCSEYLDESQYFENTIENINNEYRKCFKDLKHLKNKNSLSYSLFLKFDTTHDKTHNMFWCREWGYGKINCDQLKKILNKVHCNKMVIAHCPQFANSDKPQMINFECQNDKGEYLLARIDLGMSRCFDYNENKLFINNLSKNYNRKIAVLKLNNINNNLTFDAKCIITNKLSCIEYLLLKYGFTKEDWLNCKIDTNWLGFDYINKISTIEQCDSNEQFGLCCILSSILNNKCNNCSIDEYKKYNNNIKHI